MTRRKGTATVYATVPCLADDDEMERRALERARRVFGEAPLMVDAIRVTASKDDGTARYVQYVITKATTTEGEADMMMEGPR